MQNKKRGNTLMEHPARDKYCLVKITLGFLNLRHYDRSWDLKFTDFFPGFNQGIRSTVGGAESQNDCGKLCELIVESIILRDRN